MDFRPRRVLKNLVALVRRQRVEGELDAELRHFVDESIDAGRRKGLSREAAARAARLAHGDPATVKDYVRDAGWETALDTTWRDIRYSVRSLRKSPGFTAVAVLTLALGIGATTAIFSLLDAVILKSLPVRNPGELVLVRSGGQYPVFQVFQIQTDIFSDLLATSGITRLDVEVQDGVREQTPVSLVSGSYFATLGVQPVLGRPLTSADDRVIGEGPVAVASHAYWQRRFGGDPSALDRVIRISGTPITIVGIAPQGFFGDDVGSAPDLWIPLTMWGRIVPGRNVLANPGTSWLRMIGRVQPGLDVPGAQRKLTQIFRRTVADLFGPKLSDDARRDIEAATVVLDPASGGISSVRTQFAGSLRVLMGAVVLVLLIACANIANLLLARAGARRREIDVRLALGVSRARLMRQLLTESLTLAAAGGVLGAVLAWAGREALLRLISADGSRLPVPVTTDARLVIFIVVLSTATAVLFGLAPAWQSARVTIVTSLAARHEAGGPSRQRVSAALLVAQVAVSLVLLMGAGLFLRTMANLRDVDLGFASERLIVLEVTGRMPNYAGDAGRRVNRQLLDRIAAMPGVTAVSLAENGMLKGPDNGTNLMHPKGFVAGPTGFPRMRWDVVGPRFFGTAGVAIAAGRDFTDRDNAVSPAVVAINEELARQLFKGIDPIGQRLVWGAEANSKELEIVAVVRDVKQTGPRSDPQMRFYLPYFQIPIIRPTWMLGTTRFWIRTDRNPAVLTPMLRQLIPSEDARLSVTSVEAGPALVARTMVRERMVATLLVAFAAVAAGLACLGLYGLIAYQVVQRTGEIGVRMALGARPGDVVWTMLRRAILWIAAGIALGIPLALAVSRVVQSLLFGLEATDFRVLVGAAIVMSIMGVLAAFIPARRASRVDPLIALRAE